MTTPEKQSGRRSLALALAVPALALLLAAPLNGASDRRSDGWKATKRNNQRTMQLAPRPPITKRLIPFSPKRKREMTAYSERHYGERAWRLRHPRVIVEHIAVASSAGAVYNVFAPDVPDPELHELPNVCAHFVVASSGHIFQLVNLRTRCRHTVGLNWTAIGIEHVGFHDADVLDNSAQLAASLRLTQYLRCRFHIKVRNVIGHSESLSSPYHRELVPSLRSQTHGDWSHHSMDTYRSKLRRLGSCG